MRRGLEMLSAVAIASLLAGCVSSISLKRLDPADPASAVGVPLPLMYTRYPVSIAWQLVSCADDKGPTLVIEPSVELGAPVAAPDPAHVFVVDPASLSSVFKTSQLKVEYAPSGAPIALNAKIEDRAAEVIGALAVFGAGWVRSAAVGPAPAAIPGSDKSAAASVPTCSEEAAQWVAEELALRTKVKADTALLDDAVAALKRLNEVVLALGPNLDEATKARLVKLQQEAGSARLALEASTKRHARALGRVQHRDMLLWPHDGSQPPQDGRWELPAEAVDRWRVPSGTTGAESTRAWLARQSLSVHLSLARLDGQPVPPGVPVAQLPPGIPLRMAAEGALKACVGTVCGAGQRPTASRVDRVLQLGPIFYLPCTSRPFSSVECSYAADEAGQLKAAGSLQSNAPAEAALGALNKVVEQVIEARTARSTAETKRLEAEAAYLKAKKAVDDARSPPAADPQADIKSESAALLTQAARLDAERALIEADIALSEARQKATSTP